LMVLTVGGLLVLAPEELTIGRFAALQLGSWTVTAVLLVWVVRDRLPRKLPKFRKAPMLALLRGGAPFALAIFLATAYTRLDAVMIERLLPAGDVAADHYAAGYRLLDAMNTIGWLLAGLLIPMYARLRAKREPIQPLLRFSGQLLLAGSACAAIPLAFYAWPVTDLLYDFADVRTGNILCFLSLTFMAQSFNYAYGSLLSATGYIGRMNRIYALGIVLNLGGNWLVLPTYGAAGAAAVTLLTQTFIALTQALLAHRWLSLPGGVIDWGRILILLALLGTCGRALIYLEVHYIPGLLALGFGGLAFATVLKLIDWKAVRKLGDKS
ncbi:MAG: polysaccharide biosynthesis C-terminal domain-containing protein, partial [Bacteroidota bacterium]